VESPQVGEKPEGWCGIEAVALAVARAVIANFQLLDHLLSLCSHPNENLGQLLAAYLLRRGHI